MGYQHGKTVFDVWTRSGVVEKMMKDRHQEEFHNTQSKNNVRMEGDEKHTGTLLRIYDVQCRATIEYGLHDMTIDSDENYR